MKRMSPNIFGIYLAAGNSSRMGENKLSLPLRGTTLGSLGLFSALKSDLKSTVIVTKENDSLEWLDPIFFTKKYEERWTQIPCLRASEGQAYSLKCGLNAVHSLQAEAALIMLADQPFISAMMINHLLSKFTSHEESNIMDYVAACYEGVLKPPILFSHRMFPSLYTLEGDIGARNLIRKNDSLNGAIIECKDEWAFYDVDTKQAYKRVMEGDIERWIKRKALSYRL